jgi:molybdenum cofactor cytidylyltransferase
MNKAEITGIISAAGFSVRMGSFKPLKDFQGKTYIENITEKLEPHCGGIVIVTGFKFDEIEKVIRNSFSCTNIHFAFNPDFALGMFTSLKRGLSEAHNKGWFLYHFVDQPFFPSQFYSDFISQIDDNNDWIQPSYKGRMGHPVIFSLRAAEIIKKSPDDANLRDVARQNEFVKKTWDCRYEEVLIDFDTEESIAEYQRLKKP